MAIQYFQAEKWSARVELLAADNSIAETIANTSYQAEATGAKSVKLNKVADPTILDYTDDTDITTQQLTDSQVEMLLNQKKYFSFTADDVQLAQSQGNFVDAAMTQGARRLALAGDAYAFGSNTYGDTSIPSDNKLGSIGSSISITSANVEEQVYAMGEILDVNEVPRDGGRWLIVPPWFMTKMNIAKLTHDLEGNAQTYAFGRVLQFAGFNVVVSNKIAAAGTGDDEYQVLAMSARALPFASQINNMEVLRNPSRFGNIVRGLYVFGAELLFPEEVAVLSCEKGAEA